MNGTDILITAIEGGINHWAETIVYEPSKCKAVIADSEEGDMFTLYPGLLLDAASEVLRLYPNTNGARYIREDDIDAEAADMIVQVACFGEVIYG